MAFLHQVYHGWSTTAAAPFIEVNAEVPFGATCFQFDELRFTSSPTLFTQNGGELWVLDGIKFVNGLLLFSCHEPTRFRYYLRHMVRETPPAPPRSRRRPSAARQRNVRDLLLAEFPWLTDADFEENSDFDEIDSSEPEVEHDDTLELDEDEYEAIRQRILSKRAEFRMEEDYVYFYVRHRGGPECMRKTGEALYCGAMFARRSSPPVAIPFCARYQFPSQKSFHYSVYGENDANQLSLEWTRIGNYFCALWVAQGCDPSYEFTADDIENKLKT